MNFQQETNLAWGASMATASKNLIMFHSEHWYEEAHGQGGRTKQTVNNKYGSGV